jgi:ABC-type branched-subunit amino acid transport system permease subunit
MLNEHAIIIALALLIFWLAFGGKAGMVAAILSAIMMVGALRHPEIALSKPQVGTQQENLHATMLLVGLILIPPMVWLSLKRLFRRGGR